MKETVLSFSLCWKYCALWVAWAAAIFIGSSVPGQSLPDLSVFSTDKLLHTGVYAVLSWFGVRALRFFFPQWPLIKIYLFTFLINGLYALSDEWHQSFVPNRSCEVFDVLADMAGILITIGLYHWFSTRYNIKTN